MITNKTLLSIAVTVAVMLMGVACSSRPAPATTPTAIADPALNPDTSASSDAPPGTRTFVIDSEQTIASYIVDEEFLPDALSKYGISIGRTDTVGSTPVVEGSLELNLDDLTAPIGENMFRVDLSQLVSDQSLRDQWLKENGPQFSKYPEAKFTAASVSGAPTKYTEGEEVSFSLSGDLTIREITQPATFDVTASLDGANLVGSASAELRMTDFGIDPPDFANTLRVADAFRVRIDFVATEQ